MLRVAVPNKGPCPNPPPRSSSEAGYRRRTDPKDLTVIDPANGVEFFFLRPKDIAIYVGSGQLDFGITGRDLAAEADAPVDERLALGFGSSTLPLRGPGRPGVDRRGSGGQADRHRLPEPGPKRLGRPGESRRRSSGSTVPSRSRSSWAWPTRSPTWWAPGRTLRLHDLVAFGDSLCDSEAVLIERAGNGDDPNRAARDQLAARVQGVVFGQQYLMLDYDCPRSLLDRATEITPGLESPTIAPLADPDWVAVRALVPRRAVNAIMDELAAIGAKAILASDIRFCRF